MATITLNGAAFSGQNIVIRDNQIFVDGELAEAPKRADQILEVRIVEGTVASLTADGSVTAHDIKGSVSAGGSVKCNCVGGAVSAGGSVNCGRVGGAVSAGGNIRHA